LLAITGNKGQDEIPIPAVREGDVHLNSLKIERDRWVVRHAVIDTLKESQSDDSETTPGIMHDATGISSFII
jgi:hypothetical protein